jgi:hypothetical protein
VETALPGEYREFKEELTVDDGRTRLLYSEVESKLLSLPFLVGGIGEDSSRYSQTPPQSRF